MNEEFERHEMGLRKLTNEIGCLQLQLREKEREGKEIINMMKVEIEQAKRENGQSEIKWLEEKADLKKYIEESQERI